MQLYVIISKCSMDKNRITISDFRFYLILLSETNEEMELSDLLRDKIIDKILEVKIQYHWLLKRGDK